MGSSVTHSLLPQALELPDRGQNQYALMSLMMYRLKVSYRINLGQRFPL